MKKQKLIQSKILNFTIQRLLLPIFCCMILLIMAYSLVYPQGEKKCGDDKCKTDGFPKPDCGDIAIGGPEQVCEYTKSIQYGASPLFTTYQWSVKGAGQASSIQLPQLYIFSVDALEYSSGSSFVVSLHAKCIQCHKDSGKVICDTTFFDTTLTVFLSTKPHFQVDGPPGHTLQVGTYGDFFVINPSLPDSSYFWTITNQPPCAASITSGNTGATITVFAGPYPGKFYLNCKGTLGSCDSSSGGGVDVYPVSKHNLLYFTSKIIKSKVILAWKTADENNTSGFDIERSEVGGQMFEEWKKVGFIQGQSDMKTSVDYSYEDSRLNPGKYKYRLKQIEFNGDFEFFQLREDIINRNTR